MFTTTFEPTIIVNQLSFHEWLSQKMRESRLSNAALGRQIGVSGEAIRQYKSGSFPSSEKVGPLAEALGVKQEELLLIIEGKAGGPVRENNLPESVDMAMIPLVAVRASAGNGEVPFETHVDRYAAFDRNQMRRIGINPDRLVIIAVSGNSMYPTLSPGDFVLVELFTGDPIRDGTIYVFKLQWQGVIIKRVFWQEDGSMLLKSDNRDEPYDFTIQAGDESEWKVIGRVVRVEKNL